MPASKSLHQLAADPDARSVEPPRSPLKLMYLSRANSAFDYGCSNTDRLPLLPEWLELT